MRRKHWIIGNCILLILVLILFLISGTMAAYTSRSFVKGVATTPKQGLGLTSDYLVVVAQNANEEDYAVRKILLEEKAGDDKTPYTISFYVQNSSDGMVNKNSMRYKLTVTGLPAGVRIERDNLHDITDKVAGGIEAPLMPAYKKTTHFYKITIPKDKIQEVLNIVVKAVPNADSDSSGNMIAAIFKPSVAGVIAGFSYRGEFIDRTQDNKPSNFAAFNYEILAFNATEGHTMVLTWDTRYVEIDPLFLKKINVDAADVNGSVEFTMDAKNNSYLVKFYRLEGQNETAEWQSSWDELKKYITFTEKEKV